MINFSFILKKNLNMLFKFYLFIFNISIKISKCKQNQLEKKYKFIYYNYKILKSIFVLVKILYIQNNILSFYGKVFKNK